MNLAKTEPVFTLAGLGTLVGAVLAGILRNYTSIPNDLAAAIVELVVFIVPILVGLWIARSQVTPVAKLKKESE